MKKIIFTVLFLFPFIATAKIKVVTTIPDLAALTQEVGRDLVKATSLAGGDQDPHYIEPKPSYALALNQADLLVSVGLQLESGWLPVLLTQARNPKVQRGRLGYLEASEGINALEIPHGHIDRSHGDVHPEGNPHYWMNPHNGLVIAKKISRRLAQLDPTHSFEYEKNFQEFEAKLKSKILSWENDLQSLKGQKIITHHKSFSYFTDWAGLKTVALIEPKPGIPPAPNHILSLIHLISSQKIAVVISENYYDPKPSQELAKKTGVKVLMLPTSVGGEPTVKTYADLFDFVIRRLKETL